MEPGPGPDDPGGLNDYNYVGPQAGQTPMGSHDGRYYYLPADFRVQFNPPLDPDELVSEGTYWSYIGGGSVYAFVRYPPYGDLPADWVPYSPPEPEPDDGHHGDCDHLQSQIDDLHEEMDNHVHEASTEHAHDHVHNVGQHYHASHGGVDFYYSDPTSGPI